VLQQAADHARTAHGMAALPPEVVAKVKAAIKDD
jgi:predicted small metal-binding protein